jgi:hypothetical protein
MPIMSNSISLHVGLNSVNPGHYQGWQGPLTACEMDASDMKMIAQSCGFQATGLLTANASRKAVTKAITAAARALQAGDTFFLTHSGHGGQLQTRTATNPTGFMKHGACSTAS